MSEKLKNLGSKKKKKKEVQNPKWQDITYVIIVFMLVSYIKKKTNLIKMFGLINDSCYNDSYSDD